MAHEEQIQISWTKILNEVGYKHTGHYNLEVQKEVAQSLGNLLFDYLTSSINDMNWEGFEEGDLIGISRLLADMALYQKSQ